MNDSIKLEVASTKGTAVENSAFKNTVIFRMAIHPDGRKEHFYSLDHGEIWTPYTPDFVEGGPPDVDIIDAVARDVLPELPAGEKG